MATRKDLKVVLDTSARNLVWSAISLEQSVFDDAPGPNDYAAWKTRWESVAVEKLESGENDEAARYTWMAVECGRLQTSETYHTEKCLA